MQTRIALLLLSMALLCSCNKDALIQINGVETVSISWCPGFLDQDFLIDTEEQYHEFQQRINDAAGCESHSFPFIDFDTRTLIGRPSEIIACSVTSNLEVFADPDQKEYLYKQQHYPNGDCGNTINEMYFVSIPKLPEGYSVSYEVLIN